VHRPFESRDSLATSRFSATIVARELVLRRNETTISSGLRDYRYTSTLPMEPREHLRRDLGSLGGGHDLPRHLKEWQMGRDRASATLVPSL
jgi:hypothetical protein